MAADGPGSEAFDIDCRRCSRLASFLRASRERFPGYHCRPVPSWGKPGARLLIVGLAPGFHGANATGRPFTGDHAGILLYQTLYDTGFASAPESLHAGDDLKLLDCRITNAVRCVPPQNRPTPEEVRRCNPYLRAEIEALPAAAVMIALGTIAHGAVLRAMGLPSSTCRFAHGARHAMDANRILLDSYHCSRYNTQTGRLTRSMFFEIFASARALLDSPLRDRDD